ncbi:MAG: hypothetical protein R3B72_03430 [Polyangiaceae bacterium]
MPLSTVHQILIAGAIVMDAIYALRALVLFARGGGPADLLKAAVATVIGVGLGLYLRRFREKLRASESSSDGRKGP